LRALRFAFCVFLRFLRANAHRTRRCLRQSPRPALAALAALGGARAALALARAEPRATLTAAAALALSGLAGLAALHALTHLLIGRMCDEECTSGNMADIPSHWQVPGCSAFFVAEDAHSGDVIASVAVRRGGLRDEAGGTGGALSEPEVCSVWKVSTRKDARGCGAARAVMAAAEAWARDVANAQRMVLVTGSPGAKRFYARTGYALTGGALRGTEASFWCKALQKADDAKAPR
jgi:GNAT superfamily N-acetyltransferase